MANYNLKIIDNKVIFDGHAENQSDCHTLTLLCNLLEKNTKTIDYKMGYAEFELDDLPSENKFWLSDSKTFSINGTMVRVNAMQATSEPTEEDSFDDAFITAGNLRINLSFSQEGVTVHNVGNLQAKARLGSELDLNSYFSTTLIPSIAPGETALFPFLDNIKLRSIVSNDGQNISEGDIVSENGTKLTVSKIKSVDLTTLSGWVSLSPGSYSITIVAKADGYRDSEPSAAVSVTKPVREGGDLVMAKGDQYLFSMNESSDIDVLSGSFVGTPTFYTTNNNANTIHLKPKGYDLIAKINDDNNTNPPTANEFFTAFGITATNKETSLVQRRGDFITTFSSRLSTTEGTDGGEFSNWGLNHCDNIKDLEQENLLLVVYDSLTDTAQAFELDDYDPRYGTFTTSAVVGYNTMAAFVELEPNPDIAS